ARQVDADGRALPRRAVDPHVAARLPDEAIDHREPEAGALAGRLRREEWLEHLAEDVGGDPRAGVAYRDDDVVTRLHLAAGARVVGVEDGVTDFDRQPPEGTPDGAHGVAGIDR